LPGTVTHICLAKPPDRFADYKEKAIDLFMRVTTVSIRTVAIVNSMKDVSRQFLYLADAPTAGGVWQ
jgi:hypothetical protein